MQGLAQESLGEWCGEGALHRLGGRLAVGDPQEDAVFVGHKGAGSG
jgi:hypothetical protein